MEEQIRAIQKIYYNVFCSTANVLQAAQKRRQYWRNINKETLSKLCFGQRSASKCGNNVELLASVCGWSVLAGLT